MDLFRVITDTWDGCTKVVHGTFLSGLHAKLRAGNEEHVVRWHTIASVFGQSCCGAHTCAIVDGVQYYVLNCMHADMCPSFSGEDCMHQNHKSICSQKYMLIMDTCAMRWRDIIF